jgi:hypothetical protein
MSALGHLRPIDLPPEFAACPLQFRKRTNSGQCRYVRLVPIATERSAADSLYSITSSGAGEQRWRRFEAERFGGLDVHNQLEQSGLLNRKVGWIGAFEHRST